jgi:hypothetical protein
VKNSNKNKIKIGLFLIAAFIPNALATNVTIEDGSLEPGIGQGREDQEGEPIAGFEQKWDLEAFVRVGNKLSIVGGFPLTTWNSVAPSFKLGDVFIDTNDDYAKPPTAHLAPVYSDGFLRNADLRYEYVLKFWRNPSGVIDSFSAIQLTSGSRLRPNLFIHGKYPSLDDSNPWAYVDEGLAAIKWVGGGTISYTSGLTDVGVKTLLGSDINVTGGLHNVMTLNFTYGLDPLTLSARGLHLTLGCGNDNLLGDFNLPVPDGGSTFLLAGMGLMTLTFLRNRKS